MGAVAELVGIRPALWIGLGVAITAPLFLLPLWRVKAAPESPPAPSATAPMAPDASGA